MSMSTNPPVVPPVIPRTGIGIDVHAFAAEDEPQPLWLGGLFWEGERGLSGHSDGDPVAMPPPTHFSRPAGSGIWARTSVRTGPNMPGHPA